MFYSHMVCTESKLVNFLAPSNWPAFFPLCINSRIPLIITCVFSCGPGGCLPTLLLSQCVSFFMHSNCLPQIPEAIWIVEEGNVYSPHHQSGWAPSAFGPPNYGEGGWSLTESSMCATVPWISAGCSIVSSLSLFCTFPGC